MPKSARASKAPKKKVVKSTKVATKKVAKATPKKASSSGSWNTPYLHTEQQDFHKSHPNAQMLIAVFIVLTVVFLVAYIFPMTQ